MVEKISAVVSDDLSEYHEEPHSRKSSKLLGERLSKEARTQLVQICLRGLREDQDEASKLDRQRGRPRGVDSLLAEAVGVTTRTVQNWVSEDIGRACDLNSDALAEIAYKHYPGETAELLREDAEGYLRLVDVWLLDRGSEYREEPHSRKSRGI